MCRRARADKGQALKNGEHKNRNVELKTALSALAFQALIQSENGGRGQVRYCINNGSKQRARPKGVNLKVC